MPNEPTPTPTPAPTPTGRSVRVSLAPGAPAPAPTPTPDPSGATPPADPPAPDDDQFVSERQRRRFSELVGRVGMRERERDDARSRLDHVLTRNAERIAATSLSEPADMWLEGATVDDLLTEDGSDVDGDKVKAIVDGLVAKRPGLRRPPEPQPLRGIHAVGGQIPEEKPSLESAFRRIAAGRGGMP
jgi:hypothetical protein